MWDHSAIQDIRISSKIEVTATRYVLHNVFLQ